jgi:N,N'-diacetyllegionaminate synthase
MLIKNFFNSQPRCLIIAEIGVNHNGDMDLALKMIDAAKNSGADAVKFQTFITEKLVSRDTPKVNYQNNTTSPKETHYEMLKKLELPYDEHLNLKNYCEKKGLTFLSTPYDIESAKFLLELNVDYFKTASADLVDLPLQRFIAKTKKPTIISVGMSSLDEVRHTMNIYNNEGNTDTVLLHCVSNYPCSDKSINLNVIKTLQKNFMVPVGYSDHSIGNEASISSIALGACVIEKHFTLDKTLIGPDHLASSTPREFSDLVISVRRTERMLGSPTKKTQIEEKQMALVSRKSIVLNKALKSGEIIQIEHLELMRPGTGLMAKEIDNIVGRKVIKDLNRGHQIKFDDFQ